MGWLPPSCAPHHYSKKDSSLLTRGKHLLTLHAECLERLIPAHAGKTPLRAACTRQHRAHPRSHGENHGSCLLGDGVVGSSPLTRGKRRIVAVCSTRVGLIPAHAGKTDCRPIVSTLRAAHPRSHGENTIPAEHPLGGHGSSPLTRGKRALLRAQRRGRHLIPAHAGKTKRDRVEASRIPAHPRSRGENHDDNRPREIKQGSSPLTRGKPVRASRCLARLGLIPAHAGKTGVARYEDICGAAHPRSRGENIVTTGDYDGNLGSSPLTRGKRVPHYRRDRHGGLIPAHAGKTFNAGRFALICQAHPRSHGENTTASSATFSAQGSSPLTRGKPGREHHQPVQAGLIPAHAGKTTSEGGPA